ncbi:hypothetical protein JCM9492_15010 [Aquifex pyrophilus]
MKKKTYVFDEETLRVLSELKKKLGKKEVRIIKEALMYYYEKLMGESLEERIKHIENKIRELELRVKRLEEKNQP